jgi:hypothetical protein
MKEKKDVILKFRYKCTGTRNVKIFIPNIKIQVYNDPVRVLPDHYKTKKQSNELSKRKGQQIVLMNIPTKNELFFGQNDPKEHG